MGEDRQVGDADKQDAEHRVSPEMQQLAVALPAEGLPELVELVRQPTTYSPEIVTRAYEAHQRELFGFALRSARDREAAAELVQETFLRLISALRAGQEPSNIRAWLYRVCANLAVSRARRIAVADRWLPRLLRSDMSAGPETEYLRAEGDRRLTAALDQLSNTERTALMLAARGFSGREIAAAIGKHESATRGLLFRARLRLRQRLDAEEKRP